MNIRFTLVAALMVLFGLAQQDLQRISDQFKRQRPRADRTAKPPRTLASEANTLVGITIWQLRPSTSSDDPAARLLVQQRAAVAPVEWTPERVERGVQFAEGAHVRLSIEAPRPGYLYVVDREEYTGGRLGAPLLIFPTTRLRGGDNQVIAGRLIDIPGQLDNPPYLTLKRTREDHIGEILTVLVTHELLAEVVIGSTPVSLSEEQFDSRERKWTRKTDYIEMGRAAGKPWTSAERAAGAGTRDLTLEKLLTEDDPLPQTIYRVSTNAADPILVDVPLRIRN
jgi:hypothetical protein